MSNFVKNILRLTGDQKEIDLLMDSVKADRDENDLSQPPMEGIYYGRGTIDFRKIIPQPAFIFLGNLGTKEEKETGNRNWYNWNRKFWGVKRNASNCYKPEKNTIRFLTDWAAPLNVIETLSWLFKDVRITMSWADEDLGSNCGRAVFLGGKLIDGENMDMYSEEEAYTFAKEVWSDNAEYGEDTETTPVKTFKFVSNDTEYTCCLAKMDDNSTAFYYLNDEGYWESLLDAILCPPANLIVPLGYVCVKNEAENKGVLECLVSLGIVEPPAYSVPVGQGYARYELCELHENKLNEWDASGVLYKEN